MMNIYLVEAEGVSIAVSSAPECGYIYDHGEYDADFIVAPSRGRAKSLFYKASLEFGNLLEFTNITRARIVATDVDLPEGVYSPAEDDPYLSYIWADARAKAQAT